MLTYMQIRILAAVAELAAEATEHEGVLYVSLTSGHIAIRSDGRISGCCSDDRELAFDAAYDKALYVSEALRRQAYPDLYEPRAQ